MHACAELCCADSPDSPTFAMPCRADLPDSPTFAEPCCADSPDSRTLAKGHFREKCDSPRHIRTSNSPFSQIWGKWPLLRINTILKCIILHFFTLIHLDRVRVPKLATASSRYTGPKGSSPAYCYSSQPYLDLTQIIGDYFS
jgi:hypothetical protein